MPDQFRIDPALYRKARKRILQGKLGVCPYKLGHKTGFILFHITLKKVKRVCYDFSIPLDFIRADKKARYGFYYIPLFGTRAKLWMSVMRGNTKSTSGLGWRSY